MTKDRAFKVFLALPSDVIDRLAEMGDAFQTDDEITKAVSRYVMLLYARRQGDRAEIHKMANIGDLRWRLYSLHQKETESLPPTPSALNRRIQRSIFVTELQVSGNFQQNSSGHCSPGFRSMDGRSFKTGLVLS